MSFTAWKQWFCAFIHNRPADDDWSEIMLDLLGLWPVWGTIAALMIAALLLIVIRCDRDLRRPIEK